MPKRKFSVESEVTSSSGESSRMKGPFKEEFESEDTSGESWDINETDVRIKAEFAALRELEKQERKARALKSVADLLSVSKKYSSRWKDKLQNLKSHGTMRQAATRKAILNNPGDMNNLKYFTGNLRPYQVEGVLWMKTLFMGGINGILADEMGLGKTIQIIALFSYLFEKNLTGPHLVVGPLSTLINWKTEFKKFSPKTPVVVFHGTSEERSDLKQKIERMHKMDHFKTKPVVITNYGTALNESEFLNTISWKYVVVDEAQRIKNHLSQLAISLRQLKCVNKMLLTGTPLQNNMTELWALLNFIMPELFNNINAFSSIFMLEDMEEKQMMEDVSENNTLVSTIHRVLAPFMLRRLKREVLADCVPKKDIVVYCPMSHIQRKLYKDIINKNVNSILQRQELSTLGGKRSSKRINYKDYDVDNESDDDFPYMEDVLDEEEKLDEAVQKVNFKKYYHDIKFQNPMMMFRKVVDHPYLISMPVIPGTKEILINEKLVEESGKMLVLDAMLNKLQKQGHKVLIFSTLVIMLDLVEDYMIMRDYQYRRLDGRLKLKDRQVSIDEFNNDPNILAFLISTRAGGLGINLTGADTVIMYDRDWNPQADSQAQDRCHRIGQTKPVMIYTLVTKNTIDEKVMKCGDMKRRLERMVIKDGKFHLLEKIEKKKNDYSEILKLFESDEMRNVIHPNGYVFSDEELERLLDRRELYKEMARLNLIK